MLPPSRKVNLHPRASHSEKTQSLISDEASSYDSEDYDIQGTL